MVASLKRSLVSALTEALVSSNGGIGELVQVCFSGKRKYDPLTQSQELGKAVTNLESSQEFATAELHESLFKASFDYLFKFKALYWTVYPGGEGVRYGPAKHQQLDNSALAIAHYAGRKVSGLLGYQAPSTKLRKSFGVPQEITRLLTTILGTSYEQILGDIYGSDCFTIDGPRALLEAHFIPEILQSE